MPEAIKKQDYQLPITWQLSSFIKPEKANHTYPKKIPAREISAIKTITISYSKHPDRNNSNYQLIIQINTYGQAKQYSTI